VSYKITFCFEQTLLLLFSQHRSGRYLHLGAIFHVLVDQRALFEIAARVLPLPLLI